MLLKDDKVVTTIKLNKEVLRQCRSIKGFYSTVIEILLEMLFEKVSPIELQEILYSAKDKEQIAEAVRKIMGGSSKATAQTFTKKPEPEPVVESKPFEPEVENKLNEPEVEINPESFWG